MFGEEKGGAGIGDKKKERKDASMSQFWCGIHPASWGGEGGHDFAISTCDLELATLASTSRRDGGGT